MTPLAPPSARPVIEASRDVYSITGDPYLGSPAPRGPAPDRAPRDGLPRGAGEAYRFNDYCNAYRKYRECMRDLEEEVSRYKEFQGEVDRALERWSGVVNALLADWADKPRLVEDVTAVVRERLGGYPADLTGVPEELRGRVEGMLKDITASESVKHKYDAWVESRERTKKCLEGLKEALKAIIERFKHGEPLAGHCRLCPRVVIGREAVPRPNPLSSEVRLRPS